MNKFPNDLTKSQYEQAWALIEKNENWRTGSMCRQDNRYCLLGACCKVMGFTEKQSMDDDFGYNPMYFPRLWRYVRDQTENNSPYMFNDSHTHVEVLQMFSEFISTLED